MECWEQTNARCNQDDIKPISGKRIRRKAFRKIMHMGHMVTSRKKEPCSNAHEDGQEVG